MFVFIASHSLPETHFLTCSAVASLRDPFQGRFERFSQPLGRLAFPERAV